MAQHFFNCVPPLISAIFGNSYLVEVPDRRSNYNFQLIQVLKSGISTNSRQCPRKLFFWPVIIGNLWQCSYGEVTPVFPSQISTTAEEKLGKSVWHEGYTGSLPLCLLCFSSISNTAYLRHSLHWWIPFRVTAEVLPWFNGTRFLGKKAALLLVTSRSGCIGGGMEGF